MNLFAINDDNVVFLADNKMYSTGLVRMYEDGAYHVRSVPKLVTSKVMQETCFKHISANISSRIECNCAISNIGVLFSWGDNICGQQGSMVTPNHRDEEMEDSSGEGGSEDEEGSAEDVESSAGGEENEEYQESDDEEHRRYDGVMIFSGHVGHGEIFSCNPVRRGREHFDGETPATAVCSETAFFVLTDEGSVWCVGDDARMKGLVTQDTPSHIFAKIPPQLFNGTAVASIAIGLEHMLAVCTAGFVWAWGSNQYCAAGMEEEVCNQAHPEKVCTEMWEHKSFSAVSAGDHHSVALDTDGILWEWGQIHALTRVNRRNNSMSISMNINPSPVSSAESNFTSPIRTVSCGSSFTLALDEAGRVWSFGLGDDGELGLGRQRVSQRPIQIRDFANRHPLISISSGKKNCGAVSCQGDVYIWGNNFYCDTVGNLNANLTTCGIRDRSDCISTPMLVMETYKYSSNACTAFLMGLHSRLGVDSLGTNQIQQEIADIILQPTHDTISSHDRAHNSSL